MRASILEACRRRLVCGPETTRDLSLHCHGAIGRSVTPALVAIVLHGEPGVERHGNEWQLIGWVSSRPALPAPAPIKVRGRGLTAVEWLRNNPGWHSYIEISRGTGLAYATVVKAVLNYSSEVIIKRDNNYRVLASFAGMA